MAITLKHDAFGVVPPSNAATRKYGQSLVLQQQQQKYAGQQAGYDRLFDAYKQQNQNAFQWNQAADNRVFQAKQQQSQNNFQLGRDQARLDQQAQQQRAADFNAARSRIDTHAKDMLASGNIKDPATRQRIQNLIAGKTIIMGSGFDETARQNYLDQYNAELAKILSDVPAPPTRDNELKGFLGSNYDKFKDQPWVPDGKGGFAIADIPQPAPASPTTPAEAFKAEPKTGDKYRDKAESRLMGTDGEMPQVDSGEVGEDGKKKKRDMTPQEFQREVNKLASELWGIDNPQPEKPTGFGSSSAAYYNALDSEAKPPAAGIPIAPPDSEQQALAQKLRDGMNGKIDDKAYDAAYREWTSKYGNSEEAEKYFNAADELIKSNGGEYNKEWQELISKGHNAKNGPINPFVEGEPQEAVQQAPLTTQPPSPSPQGPTVQPPDLGQPPSPGAQKQPMPLVSNEGSQNPAYQTAGGQQTQPQQVTVGGKPLAVTPGTLTPQETAARGQIMELPREQRIAALMPYDQELKGRTLEQLLEDPETKAGYAEMTKQGLTTGNYREDMLGHIDEMLQHNVLNAAGQSPPSAYAGMRADEVTDPQLKAEVKKMPRPKTVNDRNAIQRGQPYVDPDGIIRTRA